MAQTVKWLPKPQRHDFQAAEDYLSLIMPGRRAVEWRKKLAAARNDITHRKAKDILRASQLALLGEDNKHVASLINDGLKGASRREFGGGVTFAVRNAGKRKGTAVPQLYLGLPDQSASVQQPPSALKGFSKVQLAPGDKVLDIACGSGELTSAHTLTAPADSPKIDLDLMS